GAAAAGAGVGGAGLRHGAQVGSVAFSPCGKLLAWAGGDRVVGLWDAATGRLVRTFRPDKPGSHICQVAFSPDGKLLALGTEPQVLLWELAGGKVVRRWDERHQVWSLTFSPDGKVLAWGTGDHRVKLREVATGKVVRDLTGHQGRVFGLAFSPDGTLLASGGWEDKNLFLWDVGSGRRLRRLGDGQSGVDGVRFAPGGA